MIFIAAREPNVFLRVYGAEFHLEPLTYPDIDLSHILAVESELGRRILERNDGKVNRIRFDAQKLPGFPKPLTSLEDAAPGSRILILRGGGIGDMLMCTPAIRELKRRLPAGVRIALATFSGYKPLFAAHPDIDSVTIQPLNLGRLMTYDYYFVFRDPDKQMDQWPLIDFYLAKLWIDPSTVADKRPALSDPMPRDPELNRRIQDAGSTFRHIVYLNGLASDSLRDLPPAMIYGLPDLFPETLFVVPDSYLLRYPETAAGFTKIPNVLTVDTAGSLIRYVTALDACCAVITTDSSAYHIAAALDRPALAVFGPIDARLRTAYYPTVRVLEAKYRGQTCRSPCGKSYRSQFYTESSENVSRCPEAAITGVPFSPCLGSFSQNLIRTEVEAMLSRCPDTSIRHEMNAP
jgi:hypothetical protein